MSIRALPTSQETSIRIAPLAMPVSLSSAVVVAALSLLLVLFLQLSAGAYETERGTFSDEAAHFLNGLLIRDYIWHGLGQNPLAFARDYYAHYPKIAPFVWPPMFHVGLGLFLLPGWPPAPAALFFLALFAAWTAWRLFTIVVSYASPPIAIAAVVFFLTRPTMLQLTSSVMVDLAIAAFALEAAVQLARYASSGRMKNAVLFGICTAAACLTKGNGMSAVLMPAFLIGLAGRFDLLRAHGLYAAAALVVLAAAPFLGLAFYLDPSAGDFGWPTAALIWERIQFYSLYLAHELGPVALTLGALGTVATFWPSRSGGANARPSYLPVALLALIAGTIAFHLLNPHILSEGRYVALALAPIIGLSALGVQWLTGWVANSSGRLALQLALLASIAVPAYGEVVQAHAPRPLGYRVAIRYLAQHNLLAGRSVLVISNEQGEGACVAEVAVLGLTPAATVLRGSKLLASDDWMGRHFRMRYSSPSEVRSALANFHVDYVLLDSSTDAMRLPYWNQVRAALQDDPEPVSPMLSQEANPVTGPARPLVLYRLRSDPAASR